MKQNLTEAINNWQNNIVLGTEQKEIRTRRLSNDEYRIELSMKEQVRFGNKVVEISEIANLITAVQSQEFQDLLGSLYPNPNADVYRFNKVSQIMEGNFWVKRESELSRIIQEFSPDGFSQI